MDADTGRTFPEALAGAEVSDVDLTREEIYVGGERLTDERAEQMADDYEANPPRPDEILAVHINPAALSPRAPRGPSADSE